MRFVLVVLFVCASCSCAAPTRQPATSPSGTHAPPIYRLEELAWPQIDAFDRARTLFILPVGMLEQHGPHLPVGADTLAVVYEANAVAQQVSRASAGWNIVMMPTLPTVTAAPIARRPADSPGHLRVAAVDFPRAPRGHRLAARAERLPLDFRPQRSRRTVARHRNRRRMRLRERAVRRDDAGRLGTIPRRSANPIARRGDEPNILLGRADRIVRYGRPCRRRRDGGHTRGSTGPCSTGIPNAAEPSRAARSKSCAPSRLRPVGKAISPHLRSRHRSTARPWRSGGSMGSASSSCEPFAAKTCPRGRARPRRSRRLSHRS